MKDRLRDFLRKKNMNAKQFADLIGVQPSSISHILTGRNKPSIEVLEKMLLTFPDLDIKYIISGQLSEVKVSQQNQEVVADEDKYSSEKQKEEAISAESTEKPDVERVMIFYNDGSFSEYLPK